MKETKQILKQRNIKNSRENQSTHTKKQVEYIQGQIDEMRDSEENRQ